MFSETCTNIKRKVVSRHFCVIPGILALFGRIRVSFPDSFPDVSPSLQVTPIRALAQNLQVSCLILVVRRLCHTDSELLTNV